MERTAVVTGGTRGLGRAIALALRDKGCRVAATWHSDEAAARAMREEAGIAAFRWDVADFDACRDGLAEVTQALGPVDILVNNAGITADGSFHKMRPEQWWTVMHTNLGSIFNMTRQVIEGMRARHFGRIVNIISINGCKGRAGQTIMRLPRPASSASPGRWQAQHSASPSTPSPPAIATPRWWPP
jgi:acetoacetyl-CoA reductase